MPEGFDYDPNAIRAYAEVLSQASAQVEQVKATLGDTSAKAADFGSTWGDHGADFEKYMGMLVDDLGKLGEHLGGVAGQLGRGTDLVIETDTAAQRDIEASGGARGPA